MTDKTKNLSSHNRICYLCGKDGASPIGTLGLYCVHPDCLILAKQPSSNGALERVKTMLSKPHDHDFKKYSRVIGEVEQFWFECPCGEKTVYYDVLEKRKQVVP